jgi:hypothetical protein
METICRITDKLIVIVYDQYDGIPCVSGFRYFTYLPNQSNIRCCISENSQLDYHFVYLFSVIFICYYAARLKCRYLRLNVSKMWKQPDADFL